MKIKRVKKVRLEKLCASLKIGEGREGRAIKARGLKTEKIKCYSDLDDITY